MDVPPEVQKFISQVQGIGKDRWNSSKLWITIAAIALLTWFFRDDIRAALWPVTVIVCTFLVTRAMHDIAQEFGGASKHAANKGVEIAIIDKDGDGKPDA